jgi:hypothetical protein
MEVVGFKANLVFDATRPDGTHRKLLDIKRLKKFQDVTLQPCQGSTRDEALTNVREAIAGRPMIITSNKILILISGSTSSFPSSKKTLLR